MKYFCYILHMDDRVIISKKYYIKRDGKVYRIKDDTEVTHKKWRQKRRINRPWMKLDELCVEA